MRSFIQSSVRAWVCFMPDRSQADTGGRLSAICLRPDQLDHHRRKFPCTGCPGPRLDGHRTRLSGTQFGVHRRSVGRTGGLGRHSSYSQISQLELEQPENRGLGGCLWSLVWLHRVHADPLIFSYQGYSGGAAAAGWSMSKITAS
jgi:hypothetical protein